MALEPGAHEGLFGVGRVPGPEGPLELGLLLPTSFMNRSGHSLASLLASHPELAPATDLVVVLDDLDLPFARLRLRRSGSAGGHNGLASLLEAVGDRALPRLRFGIGRPEPGVDPIAYVLAPFTEDEERVLPAALDAAAEALLDTFRLGIDRAMSRVNRAGAVES